MAANEVRTPPLPVPRVNEQAAGITLAPPEFDAAWRDYATAGASAVIADPSVTWNQYVADAHLLAQPVQRQLQPLIPLTGGRPASLFVGNRLGSLGSDAQFTIGRVQPDYDDLLSLPYEAVNSVGPIVFSTDAELARWGLEVNRDPVRSYEAARREAEDSRASALDELRQRLDRARAQMTKLSPQDITSELTDELGLGQLAVARSLGVTPTAVRKWQRGEQARPEHRDRLARLAALCSVLTDLGIYDPASWLDITISGESELTPLDLFSAGRSDLVALLAAGLAEPRETLDSFDPNWRQSTAPDPEYRILEQVDGSRSAVPRRNT